MKYNKELFELSEEFSISKKSLNNVSSIEKELLKILIKKCRESNYLEYDNYIINF